MPYCFIVQRCRGLAAKNVRGLCTGWIKTPAVLLLVAKHDRSHRHLAAQLQTHQVQRRYLAVVRGRLPALQGTIQAPIGRHPHERQKMAVVERGGRVACTHYHVLEAWGPLSLVQLSLETGRTHQIRVHLAHINHPVIGDPIYGTGPYAYQAVLAWNRLYGRFHARPCTRHSYVFSTLIRLPGWNLRRRCLRIWQRC